MYITYFCTDTRCEWISSKKLHRALHYSITVYYVVLLPQVQGTYCTVYGVLEVLRT